METTTTLTTRPFLRGSLARSLYDRMIREEQLKNFNRTRWYKCDLSLIPEGTRNKFIQMTCDDETEEFIENCYEKADWYFTHLFHSFARTILTLFMTSTSANGLLGRGSMFVFSDKQFVSLMGGEESLAKTANSRKTLLDLGAGDGNVTQIMANYYKSTFVTEISPVMRKILAKRGYEVLEVETWTQTNLTFDLIACLNLLDRCDRPLTILKEIRSKLTPGSGRLLLALVLPFSQYVEVNGKQSDHKPAEQLPIDGDNFEDQLVSFDADVLRPNGLEILSWTRLPYLSEGDLDLTFYWLYDVVMVIRATESREIAQ